MRRSLRVLTLDFNFAAGIRPGWYVWGIPARSSLQSALADETEGGLAAVPVRPYVRRQVNTFGAYRTGPRIGGSLCLIPT